MRNLVLFITLTYALAGCTAESNFSYLENIRAEEKPLRIITRTLTTWSTNFVQEFKEGSEIGLLILHEDDGSLYDDNSNYINVQAQACLTDHKISWRQNPEVVLHSHPAVVYAYSPYQSQMDLSMASIPVRISPDATQTPDYMYGTQALGQKPVNSISPVALLNMKHALSLVSFQVRLGDTEKEHVLSAVQLGNKAGGTSLKCKGQLDIRNGRITGIACGCMASRLNLKETVRLTHEFCAPLQIKVIPTTTAIKEGDIEAIFVINGSSYKYRIPAQTSWKKGHKYLYRLTFSAGSFTLNEVSATAWEQGCNEETNHRR